VATIGTTHPEKPEVKVTTARERLEELPDARVERSVGREEALVVDLEHLFNMIFDDLLERIRRRSRSVARTGIRGGRGHESGRRREAASATTRCRRWGRRQAAGRNG